MKTIWKIIGGLILSGALMLPVAHAASSTGISPIFTVDLTGQTPPDLIVENVRFTPASVSVGGVATVSFRVRNLSGRTVAPPTRVRLSSDTALTASDPAMSPLDVAIPSLAAGSAYDYSGSFTIVSGSLLPGSYYVVVRVDPQNELGQSNTGNDTAVSAAKLSVAGTGGPSLVVLPATRAVNVEASATAFGIYNAGGGTMAWSASISGAPWLHLSSGSSAGTGSGTMAVTCDANSTSSPRTGTITVSAPGASPSSVAVTVTQPGASVLQPSVTTFQFSSISAPQSVNSPFTVTVQAMNGGVVQSGFNGDVQLTAEAGGNVSLRTIRLVSGSWTGNVSLDTVAAQTRIIGSTTSGTRVQGQSNPFQVLGTIPIGLSVTVKVVAYLTTPVSGASVFLGLEGQTPSQAVTDAQGQAAFSVTGSGRYGITVQKTGFSPATSSVDVFGRSVSKTVEMHSFRPPVILVPGMMGSCSEVEWNKPALHRSYPAPQDTLKMFHPYVDVVGWVKIKNTLHSAGFAVYEAPWDWRMPVIGSDAQGRVAWDQYLLPVIAKAKAETGAQKVDIIAHSMGGLLTRAYIQDSGYAGDIGRFAMVGTPNEGSCNAYYLWFGGDTSMDEENFYEGASKQNYQEWNGGDWDSLPDRERRQFYRENIQSLEELLPVDPTALALGNLEGNYQEMAYPGVENNPLYQLNQGSFANFASDKVRTKVFYSTSEETVRQIRLTPICSATGVYPHGVPSGQVIEKIGDGTVTWQSAIMINKGEPFPKLNFPSGGEHKSLVGELSRDIRDFLIEGRTMQSPVAMRSPGPLITLPTNQLMIAVSGRSQPWITDSVAAGAGISPVTGAYSNGWSQAVVEVGASSAQWVRDNPPAGTYAGTLSVFPGERIVLTAASSLGITNTVSEELQWIGTTNGIAFNLQLATTGTNPLVLVTALPAPQNLWSFSSDGVCALTWDALTNANVAGYRVYARRKDESLYTSLGTVTVPPFSTGHSWAASSNPTNWFYAVVAVSTGATESPFEKTVMNYVSTLAKFSADSASGTAPLSVAFHDQSTGGVTNWVWDFNSDGTPDSTEQNPVASFVQPGSYTVTLTVSGPNGTDSKISVAQVNVTRPSLSAIRLLTNRSIELKLTGQAGRSYEIQVSGDLISWQSLTNVVPVESVSTHVDATAANQSVRFYRVVVP